MGSGSTSRPSARTPACASSHITLESQSKNWIFIWLTLSTLRVGCSHYNPPPHFILLAGICPVYCSSLSKPYTQWAYRERLSCGGLQHMDVPFSLCFPPPSLFFLGSLAMSLIFVHLHLWRTHLTQKTLQVSGLGPQCPRFTHDGESFRGTPPPKKTKQTNKKTKHWLL